ncbi:unnamed protein product [Phytomonas sp. Hart1]|nr:unnamed protein product [Phytomonas sp. Hart1]|eukprot:CCW66516.1 unnamed protein product [Phytomonas sp. isolate Hart1]
MVRVYRESLSTGRGNDPYQLCNVLPNVFSRGLALRCGFWRGRKGKSQLPTFLDDEEKDGEMPVIRRVMESDLVVAGGPDNKATVFDITEDGSAEVLEYLEGHRDRVTGAAVYKSGNYPIIATTSADSIVRIWVPAKT